MEIAFLCAIAAGGIRLSWVLARYVRVDLHSVGMATHEERILAGAWYWAMVVLTVSLPLCAGAFCSTRWPRSRRAWLLEISVGTLGCLLLPAAFLAASGEGWGFHAVARLLLASPAFVMGIVLFRQWPAPDPQSRRFRGLSVMALGIAGMVPLMWPKILLADPVLFSAPAAALISLSALGGLMADTLRIRAWRALFLVAAGIPLPCLTLMLSLWYAFYFE